MANIVVRLVINAVALWVASMVVGMIIPEGMAVTTQLPGVVIVALIFGVVNLLIKPVVLLLSCPLTLLTLGLFTLVVNAFMLWLTSNFVAMAGNASWLQFPGGYTALLLAGLVVSIVSTMLSFLMGDGE
jgi:putative membrane protein